MSMRIVICAEVWSDNLGDQVIAQCMQGLLRQVAPQANIELLDLSARPRPQVTGQAREPARPSPWPTLYNVAAASRSARRLLSLASWFVRRAPVARAQTRQVLSAADLLVIGGGQLLADNELAFPLRLAQLTKIATSLGVPIVVLCCGVGERWSRTGSWLVARALARARFICVRDLESRRRLEQLGLARLPVEVAPDPAILAARYFRTTETRQRPTIGLGVMAPQVVARHAAAEGRDATGLVQFWVGLVRTLLGQGASVEIFTNGAAEDAKFATTVAAAIREVLGAAVAVRIPGTAQEFVELVCGYSALAAYRLHACIVGVACGVPTLGLVWDDKVRAFFHEVGLEQNAIPASQQSHQCVAQRLGQIAPASAEAAERAEAQLLRVARTALGSA
jgi:polysaccharide pyruvyl transferase WcaK-like protein